jgi:hypothetical protein
LCLLAVNYSKYPGKKAVRRLQQTCYFKSGAAEQSFACPPSPAQGGFESQILFYFSKI